MVSKFSSEKPSGSITPWQALQVGLARCASMISRMVLGFSPSLFSLKAATFGGGGAGGVPVMFSRIQAPRSTGEVRFGIRRHHQHRALAQQPEAVRIGQRHAAELVAAHVRDAVVRGQPLVDEGVVRGQQIHHAAVLAEHAVDEQLHLAAERRAQRRDRRTDR